MESLAMRIACNLILGFVDSLAIVVEMVLNLSLGCFKRHIRQVENTFQVHILSGGEVVTTGAVSSSLPDVAPQTLQNLGDRKLFSLLNFQSWSDYAEKLI